MASTRNHQEMRKCLRIFGLFEYGFANQGWKLEFVGVVTPRKFKELAVYFLEAFDRFGVPG